MGNKKHILFISSWYPNRNNPTHGIFNRYFVEAAAMYNQVSVLHACSDETIASDTEQEWTEEQDITTLVIYYRKVTSALPGISHLQKRSRLLQAFETGYNQLFQKNGKPDLIQLNVIMPAGIGALHLSKKYNIPYIINEGWSGYCPEDGNYKGFFQKLVTKRIAKDAKVIMPVSEYLKNAMLSHHLNGNYVIVPNVVDIHLFVPQPKPASTVTTYLHISTLDDVQKNVSGIIRAFAEAYKVNKSIRLIIIGDGPGKSVLQQLAQQPGASQGVLFKGRLKIEAIANELNAADALVMFSNYETFSLVIAEALACGTPVITSKAGGLTDFITPDLGLTVEKNNELQLTQALLDFPEHKAEYNREHLRNYVTARYSKEAIAGQLNAIYKQALSKNSG